MTYLIRVGARREEIAQLHWRVRLLLLLLLVLLLLALCLVGRRRLAVDDDAPLLLLVLLLLQLLLLCFFSFFDFFDEPPAGWPRRAPRRASESAALRPPPAAPALSIAPFSCCCFLNSSHVGRSTGLSTPSSFVAHTPLAGTSSSPPAEARYLLSPPRTGLLFLPPMYSAISVREQRGRSESRQRRHGVGSVSTTCAVSTARNLAPTKKASGMSAVLVAASALASATTSQSSASPSPRSPRSRRPRSSARRRTRSRRRWSGCRSVRRAPGAAARPQSVRHRRARRGRQTRRRRRSRATLSTATTRCRRAASSRRARGGGKPFTPCSTATASPPSRRSRRRRRSGRRTRAAARASGWRCTWGGSSSSAARAEDFKGRGGSGALLKTCGTLTSSRCGGRGGRRSTRRTASTCRRRARPEHRRGGRRARRVLRLRHDVGARGHPRVLVWERALEGPPAGLRPIHRSRGRTTRRGPTAGRVLVYGGVNRQGALSDLLGARTPRRGACAADRRALLGVASAAPGGYGAATCFAAGVSSMYMFGGTRADRRGIHADERAFVLDHRGMVRRPILLPPPPTCARALRRPRLRRQGARPGSSTRHAALGAARAIAQRAHAAALLAPRRCGERPPLRRLRRLRRGEQRHAAPRRRVGARHQR